MAKCKLCRINDANQTGSHILSWFLIRDAINKEGKRRRHNEISFEISSKSFVSTYFGSEILPNEIEKVKGRELTDEEIEALQNPYTRDNILCTVCEKKLAALENIISERVVEKLRSHEVIASKKYEVVEIELKECFRLFIYSLAWRSSITNFNNFKLDIQHEEALRKVLFEILDCDEIQLLEKACRNSEKICSYPLSVAFFETKGMNNNSIFSFQTRNPYCMIVNDLVFQLFFKEKAAKGNPDFMFGLNQVIPRRKTLNLRAEKLKVSLVNDANRIIIYRNLYSFIAKNIMQSGVTKFRYAFENIFKHSPSPGIVKYFKFRVANTLIDKVELYSLEHFRNVTADVIYEYYLHVQNLQFYRKRWMP